MPGVRSRIGHHKARPAGFFQCRIKELNPQIIGVVVFGQAKREAPPGTEHIFEPIFVDGIHVEGRVGQHEIKRASGLVGVVVVAIGVAAVLYLALEPVDGEVHAAEPPSLFGFFDAINR